MDNHTGKIVGLDVKVKTCRKCESHDKLQHSTVSDHNCQKNWHGNSEGIEPAAAEETLRNVEALGAIVDTLIMDDDAKTLNRIPICLY